MPETIPSALPPPEGRQFLQVPGPTPVPDRVIAAMSRPMLDHRSPQFQAVVLKALAGLRSVFGTKNPVIVFPSSGTGGWEAALVNVLSPRDRVLFIGTGHFSVLWSTMAAQLGLAVSTIKTDWRTGIDPTRIEDFLRADVGHVVKAVCVVHNETSTGVRTFVDDVREAIDAARHPTLLMVDAVSSLAAMDYQHDRWRVDVTISGSQKGLMLPPGLSFNAVSQKALAASKSAKLPKSYWSWKAMLEHNRDGFFPFTPAIPLIHGLIESLSMLEEWGLDNVFARHERHAEAVRRAIAAWGLELWCREPRCFSPAVTAAVMPQGHDAEAFRKVAREQFNISLGMGQNKLSRKAFRFGHIGYTNDATILGALSAVEMALELANVPHRAGGVAAALGYLKQGRSVGIAAPKHDRIQANARLSPSPSVDCTLGADHTPSEDRNSRLRAVSSR